MVCNQNFYCPICGNKLEEEFTIGVICPCCGNESECHDDIDNQDFINSTKEYYEEVQKKLLVIAENYEDFVTKIPEEIKDYLKSTHYSKEEAWNILRQEWIKKCYPWIHGKKPTIWNEEIAKNQLKNINIII